MQSYMKYLGVAFVCVLVLLPIGCAIGKANVTFFESVYYLIAYPVFVGTGMYLGKLARDFIAPDYISASSTFEILKSKVFWKVGPQFIGLVIGCIPVETLHAKIFAKQQFYRDVAEMEKHSPQIAHAVKNSVEEIIQENKDGTYNPDLKLQNPSQVSKEGLMAADMTRRVIGQMESAPPSASAATVGPIAVTTNSSNTVQIQPPVSSNVISSAKRVFDFQLKDYQKNREGDASFSVVAVINDPDGYVNIRRAANASSNVVGKISEGVIFRAKQSDNAWWHVKGKDIPQGYVHSSRIKEIAKQSALYCPIQDYLTPLRESFETCIQTGQDASCKKFIESLNKILPTYECRRTFDIDAIPAAWLLDDEEFKIYVDYIRKNKNSVARDIYTSKLFNNALDGHLVE